MLHGLLFEKKVYCIGFYLSLKTGTVFRPQLFKVDHEPHQLILQEARAGWKSELHVFPQSSSKFFGLV